MRAGIAIFASVALAACGRGPEGFSRRDTRTGFAVPAEVRDVVLSDMRTMLGSVSGVLAAQTSRDTAALRQAALASGTGVPADPRLERYLPAAFASVLSRTHRQFDELARSASRPGAGDSVSLRLAAIMENCVSCHSAYRLEVLR